MPIDREPLFSHITVILGDPRLPDESKIDNCFSIEDLEAIDRVKEALGEPRDYRFTYLNDHLTLLPRLIADPPDFVLNFCDTGYKNQARQELHIPALLEMLGIPYSGAGPTCLGLCYDKSLVRSVVKTHGVPVPVETFVHGNNPNDVAPRHFPALIKPNRADGSLGITEDSLVRDESQPGLVLGWQAELDGGVCRVLLWGVIGADSRSSPGSVCLRKKSASSGNIIYQ